MTTVCLKLQRQCLRSEQQHGPAQPVAGQSNSYNAEKLIMLHGCDMYASCDRHKGLVLWEAEGPSLAVRLRLRVSAFTHPTSGLEVEDPSIVAAAVQKDEAAKEQRERESAQESADRAMALFATALANTSAASSSTNLGSLDHAEMTRKTEMASFRRDLHADRFVSAEKQAARGLADATASENSIRELIERLAGDGDPRGMKEAWKTTACVDLVHWRSAEVLAVMMDNTLFAPFIGACAHYVIGAASLTPPRWQRGCVLYVCQRGYVYL